MEVSCISGYHEFHLIACVDSHALITDNLLIMNFWFVSCKKLVFMAPLIQGLYGLFWLWRKRHTSISSNSMHGRTWYFWRFLHSLLSLWQTYLKGYSGKWFVSLLIITCLEFQIFGIYGVPSYFCSQTIKFLFGISIIIWKFLCLLEKESCNFIFHLL